MNDGFQVQSEASSVCGLLCCSRGAPSATGEKTKREARLSKFTGAISSVICANARSRDCQEMKSADWLAVVAAARSSARFRKAVRSPSQKRAWYPPRRRAALQTFQDPIRSVVWKEISAVNMDSRGKLIQWIRNSVDNCRAQRDCILRCSSLLPVASSLFRNAGRRHSARNRHRCR